MQDVVEGIAGFLAIALPALAALFVLILVLDRFFVDRSDSLTDSEQTAGPQEWSPEQIGWSPEQIVHGVLGSALLLLVAVGLLMAVFSWIDPGEVGTAIIWVAVAFVFAVYLYLAHRKTKARVQERAEMGLPSDPPFHFD
jgi:hypothetical protein